MTLAKNLEEVLQGASDIVKYLRNMQAGPNVYPGVPAEYTNWRDEQQAWQKPACFSISPITWPIWRWKAQTR